MIRFALMLCLVFGLSLNAEEKAKKEFWIDVRTVEEFKAGHLKESIHIPYQEIGKKISKVTKDKNIPIYVYCKVGGRAGIAKKTLDKLGYKKVINAGGYEAIKAKREAKAAKK